MEKEKIKKLLEDSVEGTVYSFPKGDTSYHKVNPSKFNEALDLIDKLEEEKESVKDVFVTNEKDSDNG